MKITRGMLLRWLAGVLLSLLIGIMLLVWNRSDFPYSDWSFVFGFMMIMFLFQRLWRWRPTSQGSERKLKKYYLIFLVLYLIALILAGANRLTDASTTLSRVWLLIWDLMPSQTFNWWVISFVILMFLIILGFVAGCKLISFASGYEMIVFVSDKVRVHFMRKEKDQRRE
jgi:hypothetical protein